jgi:hypothetical protein
MTLVRFPGTNQTPKTKLLKRLLSQPWIGPSISLVVLSISAAGLCVALVALSYNKAGYDRETQRLQADEARQFTLQLQIPADITADGSRKATVELYFRPDNPVRLESIEATAPEGVTIKAADPTMVKPGTGTRNSFEVSDSYASGENSRIWFYLLIRTPQTPADQNTVVQIQVKASELSNRLRRIEMETRARIPGDAKK